MRARLMQFAETCDRFNGGLGRLLGWASLALVLVQFLLVVMSNSFHLGSIKLQESLFYINSLMFLGAAGYGLLSEAHVRVDLFYRGASSRYQTTVNFLGTCLLLLPAMTLVWWAGLPYVVDAWSIMEGSVETSGLHAVYLLKSFILLFALGLTLQGLSLLIRSGLSLTVENAD